MKKNVVVLDADGCMYLTPTAAIPVLEDAIDMSMLYLLESKKNHPKYPETIARLDTMFQDFDKTKLGINFHNANHESKEGGSAEANLVAGRKFSELMNPQNVSKKDAEKMRLIAARALLKMLPPSTPRNHRVSAMINLEPEFGINTSHIADFYRKYATIDYGAYDIKRNPAIEKVIQEARQRGDAVGIYTDNSAENGIQIAKALGYNPKMFDFVYDMFDTGLTKKNDRGWENFQAFLEKRYGPDFDCKRVRFYDDNRLICTTAEKNDIASFVVTPDKVTRAVQKPKTNTTVLTAVKGRLGR